MSIRHLKIFLEVYKTMNITKAAQNLFLTQPAVTRAIKELENHYGIHLFDRLSNRLSLTGAGKIFYSYAIHIIDSFDQMENEITSWDEFGTIRIGTTITLGNFTLPSVLLRLKKMHPNLNIQSTVSNGGKLTQLLLENEIDFAVIEGKIDSPLLLAEKISGDRMIPVLPPDSKYKDKCVEFEELAKEPLLMREPESSGRNYMDIIFANHEIMINPVLESTSTHAILQCVHLGLGISFLAEQLVQQSLDSGFVSTCNISDEPLKRNYYLVWHKQKYLTSAAFEAMDLFRQEC